MMTSTPQVLTEVGLVESRPEAAAVRSPATTEPADPSNGGAPNPSAEKARAVVDEFLRVIDALPEADKLRPLRDRFVEMNVPERTDQEFLLSAAFRNILKLAVMRCQERPSKAKVHIREVVNNMRLNTPKTPAEREKLRVNQRRPINAGRSSETILERAYLALGVCHRKIRAAEMREESDEDDSNVEANYVYLDRLQKRAVDLYKKIQKLEGNRYERIIETECPIVVRSTPYPEINRATAKMANRCVKRGMTPDYRDVFIIVKRISEQDDLGMSEEKQRSEATSVFKEIIDQIKNRRIKETMRNMESLEIELANADDEDPAVQDENLRRRLEGQAVEAQRKIDSVINKYADKQVRGRTSSDSDDEAPPNKMLKLKNGARNVDGDQEDEERCENNEEAPDEGDSSEVSVVDEKYLETESSENDDSEEVDCEEIIRRYGQDRERPRATVSDRHVESSGASNIISTTNGSAEKTSHNEGNDSEVPEQRNLNTVIELSSSEDEIKESMRKRKPRHVVPKRLSTLGRNPEEKDGAAETDNSAKAAADVHDPEKEASQEVIEISD